MALTFSKLFAPQQLPAAVGTIFTCPTPSTTVLKNGRVRLLNTAVGVMSVTLYAVPSGGSATASNCFLSGMAISAGSFLDTNIPTMASGDTLQGFATVATSVTISEMGGVLNS